MPRNGSGVYSPPGANYPAVSGTLITAANRNAVDADVATALTGSLAVNGESVVTANIPFSGNKLTGIGAATARTDAASIATIQDGTGVYVATVGGTADVITLTPSPAIAAYGSGQTFIFIASGANTTNVTVNISGLGAKSVTKNGATALIAGDILSGGLAEITYDGTRFQLKSMANAEYMPKTGGTFTGDIIVPDEAYGVGWNGVLEAPTKNAVYDKIESIGAATTTTSGLVELLTTAELKTGTDTTRATTADAILNALGFSAYFQSSQQTISLAGGLTLAHGLGRIPVLYFAELQCVTAELGYSIGDRVAYNVSGDAGTTSSGMALFPDVTNIGVRFGSAALPFVANKTTGTTASITAANWRLVVRAWA